MTTIRREMPTPQLDKTEFKRRYRARFYDPAFAPMQAEIDRLAEIAWDAYENSRKAPRTQRAGDGLWIPIINSPSNGVRQASTWRKRSAASVTRARA